MTQVWLFIAPGLYAHEKKLAIPFVVMSSVFFIGGAAFAHYVVFPLTWRFFGSFSNDMVTFMPRIEPAFALYMKLILTFGLIFQMPTLVLFLARMGLITARFLIRNMKYAILIMFIVGAVLSPGTDPVGQVAMAGPMFLLYLLSIGSGVGVRQEAAAPRGRSIAAIDASPDSARLDLELATPMPPVAREAAVARLRVIGARAIPAAACARRDVGRRRVRARGGPRRRSRAPKTPARWPWHGGR